MKSTFIENKFLYRQLLPLNFEPYPLFFLQRSVCSHPTSESSLSAAEYSASETREEQTSEAVKLKTQLDENKES